MRRCVESLRQQNVLIFDGLFKIALAEAEARAGDLDRAIAVLDEALATSDRTRLSRVRSGTTRARGEMLLEARPHQSGARRRSPPDRHRRREAARDAQLRTARRAVARQALPIDRPLRRRPRRPRADARRLLADARNARDRRGAGSAGAFGVVGIRRRFYLAHATEWRLLHSFQFFGGDRRRRAFRSFETIVACSTMVRPRP